jgi:hypothetical protein
VASLRVDWERLCRSPQDYEDLVKLLLQRLYPDGQVVDGRGGDGLPLSWIPRTSMVKKLNAAAGRQDRLAMLTTSWADVVDDCVAALDECDEAQIASTTYLARRAVEAFRASHHEAAMALAVSIGEPLAKWASEPRVRAYDSQVEKVSCEKRLSSMSAYKHAQAESTGCRPVRFSHGTSDIRWSSPRSQASSPSGSPIGVHHHPRACRGTSSCTKPLAGNSRKRTRCWRSRSRC